MKRISIIFIFSWLTINLIFGQEENVEIKRLIESLELAESNIQKVDTLNEIAFFYLLNSDYEMAKQYALKADSLAKKNNYKKGMASSSVRLGQVEMYRKEYEQSEEYFNEALKLRIKLGDPKELSSVYNNLGNLFDEAGELHSAIDRYELGLKTINSIKNIPKKDSLSPELAKIHNNLGTTFREFGKFITAEYHFQKSIQLREQLEDSVRLARSYMNLGSLYCQEEFMDTAQAKIFLTKSLDLFILKNNNAGQAKYLINLGNLFFHQERYEEAMETYANAKEKEAYLTTDELINIARNEGSVYHRKKEYQKALQIYEEVLEVFQDTDNSTEIAYIYHDMGNLFFDLGDFKKANYYLNKSHDLSIENKLSGLKILVLSSIKMVKERELFERKNLIQNGLIGFASFLIITLFFFNLNRKKRQLAEQNSLLAKQEIDVLISHQALKTTSARLEGIEEERKRIAAALHDKIGVMVSTAKLYFAPTDEQLSNLDGKEKDKYQKANEILDEAYEEVRRISHNMASPSLTSLGLVGEIKLLADHIHAAKQLKIKVIAHEMNERLDNQLEMQLYQIIQELITNILKHAKATEVNIELNHFGDFINIMVQDNGIGFEYEFSNHQKEGMGLDNIKHTVEALKGTLVIDSKAGRGTTISIDAPIHND
jgi:Signal transduction histidine kinase